MTGMSSHEMSGHHTFRHETSSHTQMSDMKEGGGHYRRLLIMIVLSFIAMYWLMYAMVNSLDNVVANFNQFYMAGLMTAAMVIIELGVMRSMYHNRKVNAIIMAAGVIGLIGFWMFTREQVAISNEQFLKSMIPHHAGAILMCEQAPITDPEIRRLCVGIVTSQQAEIDQMKAMLRSL